MDNNIKIETFEEFAAINYAALKRALRAFPEEEVKAFWDSEQEWVEQRYKDYVKGKEKYPQSTPLSIGLAYGLSLMF